MPPPEGRSAATAPFLGKRDQPVTPCLRDNDSSSASAQQTTGLRLRGRRASFLSQWRYSRFSFTNTMSLRVHFKGYIFHGYQTFTRFGRETFEFELYNKYDQLRTTNGNGKRAKFEQAVTDSLWQLYCKKISKLRVVQNSKSRSAPTTGCCHLANWMTWIQSTAPALRACYVIIGSARKLYGVRTTTTTTTNTTTTNVMDYSAAITQLRGALYKI